MKLEAEAEKEQMKLEAEAKEVQTILKLNKRGVSIDDIADATDKSPEQVQQIIAEHASKK